MPRIQSANDCFACRRPLTPIRGGAVVGLDYRSTEVCSCLSPRNMLSLVIYQAHIF